MSDGRSQEAGRGLIVRDLPRVGCRELTATAPGAGTRELTQVVDRIHADHAPRARVVRVEAFGPVGEPDSAATEVSLTGPGLLPVTWLQGGAYPPGELGGLHVQAVTGGEISPLRLGERTIGATLHGPYATECWLSGLRPADPSLPRDGQAREVLAGMEQALAPLGMDFSHVVRTWLFLDDILSWYDDFNRVRTEFLCDRGAFDRYVPASTGIGAANPSGAAVVAGLYALKPTCPEVRVQAVPSPLQCPALEYGSSFSRAAEVVMPDLRRLLVSGTASIAPGGETEHVGDVGAQIARTCEVVEAILVSRGMDWADVTRATAYVRDARDAPAFGRFWAQTGRPPLPVVVTANVVCRDDLLFEIEVDAVQAVGDARR